MQLISLVLLLLLTVVVSTFIARLLPFRLPLPLLQIALGAGLHYAGFEVEFDSHLFMTLFIPPLLFLDGWRIPKGAFFRDWKPILALAIGLVVFTVVGIGLFAHWLIPTIPLTVAFALAAILSPTDPVAVGAITDNTPLPSRLTHILEGESLLNDATGLVCFTFAVKAATTGTFSLSRAILSFVLVAGGGVVVGVVVTYLVGRLNRLLIRRTGEEPAAQILISLLVPFGAYMTAEGLHLSGILAAAVAGMAMHYGELFGHATGATRIQRVAVWDTIQTTLNGLIFVLLGEHVPALLRDLPDAVAGAGARTALPLLGYAAALTVALVCLRFAWLWVSLRLTIIRAARRGQVRATPQLRLLAVAATAGVRGAITLAGILTLPLLAVDGLPFPARDTVINLAMGVILLSLILASVGLPLLARGLDADLPDVGRRSAEAGARVAASEAAIRRIEHIIAVRETNPAAASARDAAALRLLEAYRRRLDYGERDEDPAEVGLLEEANKALRLQALAAERDQYFKLRRARAIDDTLHHKLVHEVDLAEAGLAVAHH